MTLHVITYALFLGSTFLLLDVFILLRQGLKGGSYSNFLFASAVGLLYATYAIYLLDFLRDNFSNYEVYAHSTSTLPVTFKLAASWAGVGGSLFLWLFCQLTTAIIYRFFMVDRSQSFSKPLLVYNILTAALGFLTISTGTFNMLPSRPPAGLGLNPLLVSFWMLIHPPVMFLAYALSLSAAIAALLSNDEIIEKMFFGLAWVAMTAAIVIGGLWAYEVLGWGGYWNWDAVETASLLPWLSMTVYFHSTSRNGRKFAAALTGFFVMFASFITRSGVLKSVHAYGLSLLGFAPLVVGGLFFVPYLLSKRKRPAQRSSVTRDLFSRSLTLSRWSLLLITLVCLAGVLTSIFTPLFGSRIIPSPNYYNVASYPFVMTFLAALIGCSLPHIFNWRRFGGMILTVLGTGVFLALVEYPVKNLLVNLGLPLILAVIAIGLLGFAIDVRALKFRTLGRRLIHIAIPLLLIGVFFSSTVVWRQPATIPLGGNPVTVDGIEVSFISYKTHPHVGVLYVEEQLVPAYSSVILTLNISSVIIDAVVENHTLHGIVMQPLIAHVGVDDVYIRVHLSLELYQLLASLFTEDEPPFLSQIDITVEHKLLIGLIWLGSALLIVGELIQMLLAALWAFQVRNLNSFSAVREL